MSKPGYVYALINPSMPGLVKVGRTERDPTVRVAELSGVTGVATPFILVFHQAFEDCELAERHAHAVLERDGRRFAANREFFETQPTAAVHAILSAPGATERVVELVGRERAAPQASLVDEMMARAHRYLHGQGDQPKDVKEGVKLYLNAGKLGSAEAYLVLGGLYYGGWQVNKNEDKALEYYRLSCEMNYAPAWAKIAAIRAREGNQSGEAHAWRRFFELALANQDPDADEMLKLLSTDFFDPRPSLELTYSPCGAKVGNEPIAGAVEFIRSHAEYIGDFLMGKMSDIQEDKYGLYNDFRGDTRPTRIAGLEEVLKWLRAL
ncbi:GIY-YIG nuclease family protein [Methylobacterium sp. yr596]|uniref:GIY-YIG nuclease family protein n=1 Tax=Methylobacterium sp. yr596 TaxID=1761800 RepID=UPI0008F3EAB2|nr:GIY-YIG nuclease family protein [Methylobacterium sp. yr596]SFE91903.1 Sel1 repeat-containing protein [Methylobacterium sp. yr596]